MKIVPTRVIRYIVLILPFLVFFLFPVYWMVITAFKTSDKWFTWPPTFIPWPFTLDSFLGSGEVYRTASLREVVPFLINSLGISLMTSVLTITLATFTAYSISRFKTGGMRFLSWILSMRMLPPIAVGVPIYVIFYHFGILNTWLALILVYTVFTSSFGVWVLVSFFNDIPRELDESAYIDGCTPFQAFTKIVLPISLPGIVAVFIISFTLSWGEFLLALLLTYDKAAQTIPVFIGRYITGFQIAWGPIAATGLVAMLPVTILTFIALRYLISGLTLGAVRG
jgi:multiple sugar transport system permease protein